MNRALDPEGRFPLDLSKTLPFSAPCSGPKGAHSAGFAEDSPFFRNLFSHRGMSSMESPRNSAFLRIPPIPCGIFLGKRCKRVSSAPLITAQETFFPLKSIFVDFPPPSIV
jgi:hypothetical protein